MSVKLLTEHHLEFLSLKGGCTGLSESTLVKMTHSWKSHVMAHLLSDLLIQMRIAGAHKFSCAALSQGPLGGAKHICLLFMLSAF